MARLAVIQTPYPGSKQIACKNSNQSIAQTSKHTDAFFSCNCSCCQLSNFVINDKAGNTFYSKCTSIKGIPCISPMLTQPLLQDGMHQDCRSQQERGFHPSAWVPRVRVPRSPHPKVPPSHFLTQKSSQASSNTCSSITSARTRALCWSCSTGALAA